MKQIARPLLDLPFEYGWYRRVRPLLFAGLSGRILDAGVGTGRNLEFYPEWANVVGINLSPAMSRLHHPAGSFDGAVATFLFCVLPDDQQVGATRAWSRVKPGGIIRLLEYGRPHGTIRRIIAAIWEPWIGWAYGAGFDRRTEEHIPEAGLELVEARFIDAEEDERRSAGDGALIAKRLTLPAKRSPLSCCW